MSASKKSTKTSLRPQLDIDRRVLPMNLEEYLREFDKIRSSGTAVNETLYYPALSNRLNGICKGLKPHARYMAADLSSWTPIAAMGRARRSMIFSVEHRIFAFSSPLRYNAAVRMRSKRPRVLPKRRPERVRNLAESKARGKR